MTRTMREIGPYAAEIEALSRAALTPWPPKGEGDRMDVLAHWAYRCPDCGAIGTHAATCGAFPGERVEHGNRVEVVPLPDHRGAVHRGDWFRQAWANAAHVSVEEAERSFETLGDITTKRGR